jgi:uncharacterized low-complexity protein
MKSMFSLLCALLFAFVLTTASAAPSVAVPGPASAKACATEATAACGKCGDQRCSPQCGETAQTCPKDCGVSEVRLACGKCGDGRCTPQCGETSGSCPKDCGVESTRAVAAAMR